MKKCLVIQHIHSDGFMVTKRNRILGCRCPVKVYFGPWISRCDKRERNSSFRWEWMSYLLSASHTNLSVSSQCRTSSAVLSPRSPFCLSSSTPAPALPGSDELASYRFKALVSVCVCVRLVHAEHRCSQCRNPPLWLTAYQCISNRE